MPDSTPRARRLLAPLLLFGLALGLSTAATFLTLSLQTETAASATPGQLPNLKVLTASDLRIDTVELQNANDSDGPREACNGLRSEAVGRKLLCFSMTSWNDGTGPLELRPGTGSGNSQPVSQRVYNAVNAQNLPVQSGGFQDYLAGSMAFHPTHNHVHFNDYATYTLRPINIPGFDSDRNGVKTTFCIIDTVDRRLFQPPAFPQYTSCGNPQGQVIPQGLSVGWGDEYTYNLDGQSVDITGIPNGDYRLIIDVDPLNRIRESDDNDNDSSACIRINGNTVSVIAHAFCESEVCDGLDNDGDDDIDEFFPDTNADGEADCVDTDDDGDGYSDAVETSMGKNPLVWCAAMRADVVGTAGPEGSVSILDLSAVAGAFGQTVPPASARLNQNTDNSISIIDLSAVAGQFGKSVTTCP